MFIKYIQQGEALLFFLSIFDKHTLIILSSAISKND
nr:MAG TPA: hypothetical protein [Bacteriophage sp.]